MNRPDSWREFGRFLAVGVVNTCTGLAVIYAAKWLLQWGDVPANLLGYGVGLAVSFALNSQWTFRYLGAHGPALLRFLAVAAVAYAVNLLTVLLALHALDLNSYLAQALGVPAYTLTSYLLSKYFVFNNDPVRSAPKS